MSARGVVWFMIALSLVSLPPAPAGSSGSADMDPANTPTPHPPILIDGDAGFQAPGSGVTRGSGTAEDPYIIEGWSLIHAGVPALRLEGTRAHVRIEHLAVLGPIQPALEPAACWTTLIEDCPVGHAMELVDARNVTVQDVHVSTAHRGIWIEQSQGILLRTVAVTAAPDGLEPPATGISIHASNAVTVANFTASAWDPLTMKQVKDISVTDATLGGPSESTAARIQAAAGIQLQGVLLDGSGLVLERSIEGFSMNESWMVRTPRGLETGIGTFHDVEFCGVAFEDIAGPAGSIVLDPVDELTLTGVAVANASGTIYLGGTELTVEASSFENVTGPHGLGMAISAPDAQVHNSSFTTSSAVGFTTEADARWNWWGATTGPSFEGPGDGTALATFGHAVDYEPWLHAPPSPDGECLPPVNQPGARDVPELGRPDDVPVD